MRPRPICQISSMGSHPCTIFAPAIASMPTTITQKYQYIQPLMKPAAGPNATRTYSVNAPSPG